MNKLIIICGLPGTGKTTLANELSKKLKIFCLHKDTVKESLYSSLQMSTLENSKEIGWPSVKIILDLARENLKLGMDVILESTFNFYEDVHIFKEWEEEFGIKIFTFVLEIGKEERKLRFENRERDRAHHDNERTREFGEKECDYQFMPGKKIFLKTNQSVEKLVEKSIEFLEN